MYINLKSLKEDVSKRLHGSDDAFNGLIHFLKYKLNLDIRKLYMNENVPVDNFALNQIEIFFKLKKDNIPNDYIIGSSSFFGREFFVDNRVLIPRPETELIVNYFIEENVSGNKLILDAGTGSGCIGISLAYIDNNFDIFISDKFMDPLSVAVSNIKKHKCHNITPIQMSWGSAIKENSVDYIVCNPPYIKKHDPHLSDLKHEPITALIADKNGLNDLNLICKDAYLILKDGGKIIMEHGYDQADEVNNIFRNNLLKPENTITDYQGHVRISIASK